MRLFRRQRSCTKPDPSTATEDTHKSWAVLRFFQSSASGATCPKESAAAVAATAAAAAAAAAAISPGENHRALQPPSESQDDATPLNYCFANQNYTPEVALSPKSRPLSPTELPLSQAHNSGGQLAGDPLPLGMTIDKYHHWQQRKPCFHFGPRQADEEGGEGRRASASTSVSSTASQNVITLPTKQAFIYQDGKFVEREVTQWPRPERNQPHLRYRLQEPYASHYGRRYKERIASQDHIVTPRQRCIYQKPIFRLPRQVMEENKLRLLTRHCLKDSFEEPRAMTAPQKICINEMEQAKIIRKILERHNYKEAQKLVYHLTTKNLKEGKAT